MKKTHHVVWDSLIMVDLNDNILSQRLDDIYADVPIYFDNVCCVKGLIVTHRNLVITCEIRPQMSIIY